MFAMTNAFSWQNYISIYPTSFCTAKPNLPVTPGICQGNFGLGVQNEVG